MKTLQAVPESRKIRQLRRMRPTQSSVSRTFQNGAGKWITVDDSRLPYILRTGKGLSPAHAPLLKFSRKKPRYRRSGNLLVMGCRVGQ
jgi:hypothetical protein